MAFADGRVVTLGYDLDGDLHRRLGDRRDGELTETP